MNVTIGQPISHRIDHMLSGTRANIALKVFGDDLHRLRRLAQTVRDSMAQVRGVVDLAIEQQTDLPILHVQLKREQIARVGLTVGDVAEALETAFSGKTVSRILEGRRSFDLVVRYEDTARKDLDTIRSTLIDTPTGGKVPLRLLADVSRSLGPNTIGRENVRRRIVVSCNVAGRALQDVVQEIRRRVEADVALPQGYELVYGGQFESAQAATRTISLLSLLVLGGILLLLTTALRSVRDALIILVNLPLAFIGGVMGVVVSGGILSVASLVGLITLFGIATRNGIMLVTHIRHLMEEEGEPFRAAVERGALERLSPILMTALSSGLALLPLVVRAGDPGSEILTPMAIVILCGLTTSTRAQPRCCPGLIPQVWPTTQCTRRGAMRPTRWVLLASVWTFLLTGQIAPGGAQETPAAVRVDLPTALGLALRDNPDLRAKRHTLGLAEGRVQQSELLFQDNPRVSIEADYRNRRFRAPTGRSTADAAVSVLQEIEIAGQPAHRRQAAASHLSYTEWVIADAERLLQLEVMRAFYELLARQESIQARRDSLETRDALLQAGRERYAQEDISVLDLNALRLDTDETRARPARRRAGARGRGKTARLASRSRYRATPRCAWRPVCSLSTRRCPRPAAIPSGTHRLCPGASA